MRGSSSKEAVMINARSDEQSEHDPQQLLADLRQQGIEPYPYSFADRVTIGSFISDNQSLAEGEEDESGQTYRLAGRVTAKRGHGKLQFMDLQGAEDNVQILASHKHLDQQSRQVLKKITIGDHIGIEGIALRTPRGELSIRPQTIELLSKAINSYPDKRQGVSDPEVRQRRRELDLMTSNETRERFRQRSRLIRSLRDSLDDSGFIEVETPILQPLYGGASASPFTTEHNALDQEMFLRIAPELYLKRCLVGNMEQVYEIGRDFRNEGLSRKHNPEFTMLEAYQAYADYNQMAKNFESWVAAAATRSLQTTMITVNEQTHDLAQPWQRITYRQALFNETGLDIDQEPTIAQIEEVLGDKLEENIDYGEALDRLFSKRVEPTLQQPTLIFDYPLASTPLAKQHRQDPRYVERWEAFIGGVELANAFSELNDPLEQRKRLEAQGADNIVDEDYIDALAQGMPPAAGIGIGLDRLAALISGQDSIREMILFPTLRS